MTTGVDATDFARDWIEAWNAHDLERVLSHYALDVELTSPLAAERVAGSGGSIRGIEALRAYWEPALAASPDLRFDLESVLTAVDGCTILYRNHRGQQVAESLFWNESGLVTRAAVAYGPAAG